MLVKKQEERRRIPATARDESDYCIEFQVEDTEAHDFEVTSPHHLRTNELLGRQRTAIALVLHVMFARMDEDGDGALIVVVEWSAASVPEMGWLVVWRQENIDNVRFVQWKFFQDDTGCDIQLAVIFRDNLLQWSYQMTAGANDPTVAEEPFRLVVLWHNLTGAVLVRFQRHGRIE